jgi:hypothetical protein
MRICRLIALCLLLPRSTVNAELYRSRRAVRPGLYRVDVVSILTG